LVNTLFETKLYQPKAVPQPGADWGRTVQIESISAGECTDSQAGDANAQGTMTDIQISRRTESD